MAGSLGFLGSLWQGAKNVGDFAGLDGSFGYQGTWAPSASLGASSYLGGIDQAGNGGAKSSMFGGLSDWAGRQNSQNWANYADIAKGIGGIGLGYMNMKNGQKMSDLYQQQQAFNQAQINSAEEQRKKNSQNMSGAFAGSSLANYHG